MSEWLDFGVYFHFRLICVYFHRQLTTLPCKSKVKYIPVVNNNQQQDKMESRNPASPHSPRRRRSTSEQLFLLRHSNDIKSPEESERVVTKYFKRLASIKESIKNISSNIELGLPCGISVYTYHTFVTLLLISFGFNRWSAWILYLISWFWQISGFVLCFLHTKRPDYEATQRKYETNRALYQSNGVSILKPLHGVPERLLANLDTYFNLNYPKYELLLCIKCREGQEPLIKLVEAMIKKYPNVDATISYGNRDWGVNPKLCNMGTGYDIAKYDLIWIADANIVCSDCVIQDMVDKCALDEKVALVHQVPWMISGPGTTTKDPYSTVGYITGGSVLDRWYFATGHSRTYFIVNHLICTCLNGMSSMIKKKHLEQVGGLKHFGQFVAEDCEIGAALDAKGFKSKLCVHPGLQNLAESDFNTFIDRRVRWARLRYNMPKTATIGPWEIVQESHWCVLVYSVALCWHYDLWEYVVPIALGQAATWCFVDCLVFALLDRSIGLPKAWVDKPNNNLFFDWGKVVDGENGGLTRFLYNLLRHYVLWLVREISVLIIISKALADVSSVAWGGKKFELRGGKSSSKVNQQKVE